MGLAGSYSCPGRQIRTGASFNVADQESADGILSRLVDALAVSGRCETGVLPVSAAAFLACRLFVEKQLNVLMVTESQKALDVLYRNLDSVASNLDALSYSLPRQHENKATAIPVYCYPSWNVIPDKKALPDADVEGNRLKCLVELRKTRAIVATCIQALMQPAPSPDLLGAMMVTLKTGDEHDPEKLAGQFESTGYQFVPEVTSKGHVALRGGLIDIWPVNEPLPVRMEFFGNTLESMRFFDYATQRSEYKTELVTIAPANENLSGSQDPRAKSHFTEYIPDNTVVIWYDTWQSADINGAETQGNIAVHAAMYEEAVQEASAQNMMFSYKETLSYLAERSGTGHVFTGARCITDAEIIKVDTGLEPIQGVGAMEHGLFEPDVFERERGRFINRLLAEAENGKRVFLFFDTTGAAQRFRETHPSKGFKICHGALTDGFVYSGSGLVVVSERDITGYHKELAGKRDSGKKRRERKRLSGDTISDWTSIEPGELVVHLEHGIGKYLGLYEMDFNGRRQEVLTIEYADNAKLHVPAAHVNLLSRYVGAAGRRAQLHRLGGRAWAREKAAAQEAVRDFAASLLEVQAERDARPGHAFPSDTPWQHEFEAAFPYEETGDQLQAVDDIKNDMESQKPMDRLVCGDVGYGKTEAAMRAAFKAVMSGRQVAMLVPTTVLAQQHFDIFTERMSAYPVRIELLSRFRTAAEQQNIIKALKTGAVDIVIGTHRLVQNDVTFKDLGLAIIDEEQRFGVEHKEKFKRMQNLVDVLTLTATPIPRTLYMSLAGTRDISMIQTAPRERLPVETVVAHNTDAIVRKAILDEINRGGQVYYLHNRVMTIDIVRRRLGALVPEARITVGHGRMNAHDLAGVMRRFCDSEFDVLLCTTIIESGMDIPNVNTIIIDRADRFGLAELHQLRGRVGRSSKKAYAYLLIAPHGKMASAARRRLAAVARYSELGSGFKLALRDLEIRGAGNILGAAQSGHIAAVGFDLYCQLLRSAIARLQNNPQAVERSRIINVDLDFDFIDASPAMVETPNSACIPRGYIEDETTRVQVYRKIAAVNTTTMLPALIEELEDRFGSIPAPLKRLIRVAEIKVTAAGKHVSAVVVKDRKLYLTKGSGFIYVNGKLPRLAGSDTDDMLDEIKNILLSGAC